ncbi:glycosyltransferase, exosortase A system-associated [Aliiglaciecola sp. 2_MG-2023]|uniref:TIGR04063 family PEP-CTERM/XrtA system glycosyltransferase n=1 Tax=unclassified Aliiglaciecola TaxID=2593648 RepID=UPI0026E3AF13|nr:MULTISPECIES: TIGR04063 family PEP-CTERM/XrtA system glycosyltransferase [unclassified Aliiglaciecola]MDO6709182.1 glycosyltransferase, exosortase A system-associated [Aliiglaciecola sp. 2_MG-2023]MDO6750330.1 glycosyltransferase, exosortase A system-associated [Aliiglaciecola sp. 1_MG-2023]
MHILDHSIPLHSGYTFRTRSILNQQRARGWETCHVTSAKQGICEANIEEVDGLKFYRTTPPDGIASKLPVLNQLSLVNPLRDRILEAIEIEKPDILHAHSPALNGLAAIKAAKKTGLPLVYEIRAFWEDAAVDHGTCKEGDLRYRLTQKMETHVVNKANAVTTICEGLRQDLLSRGIADNKITVIPNAVNIEQFNIITERNESLENQYQLKDKVVLGFLGSFYGYEGLDLIVAAMPKILQSIPNAVFLLVGGGPQEQNLKNQINQLGLQKHVIMPGRVPHSEVDKYYSLVDLLVYPRKPMRLTELVTPLKPLEAMAQGKLVLASDVGGHKELIEDGKTGWLFDSGNIDQLASTAVNVLSNRDSWPDMIENGRNFVMQIRNWKNSVANYQSIYENLLRK